MKINEITVLVVDDDMWMLRVLQKNLRNLGVTKIFTVDNGFSAVATALAEKPDLVFLDLMMPELDGIQTLKMLKTIPETQDAKVIICSGHTDVQNFGKTILLGATEYIAKPFTADIIKEKLKKIYEDIFDE